MFEPVIASIAFIVIALVIAGIGIVAAVRRRVTGTTRRADAAPRVERRDRAVNE